jgi:hypothetical protein
MNTRIEWLRPVLPAGAILFALLLAVVGARDAHAQDNVVRVEPSGVAVAPDGTFHVAVMDDPPEASLAAWVIELAFDPNIVTPTDCRSLTTPGGAVGAFDCEFTDDNNDGKDETIKMLGAILFSGSQKGLRNEAKLADITFHAVGAAASCSDLKLRILIHADSDGEETGAEVQDGRACVQGDAPATGTASPFPVTPRTSEPTPTGGGGGVPTIGGGQTSAASSGPTQPASPGGGGSTGASSTRTASAGSPAQPSSENGGGLTTSDDGTKTFVWVVVGFAALIIAGAGAWGVVRMRGRGPDAGPGPGPDAGSGPDSGPPGPDA